MPGRFPLIPVVLTGDPFCEDGFCGDAAPPAFDPYLYTHVRYANVYFTRPGFAPRGPEATVWLPITGGFSVGIEILPGAIPVTPYGVPNFAFVRWGNNITQLLDCARLGQQSCGFNSQNTLAVPYLNANGVPVFYGLQGTGAYTVSGPTGTFAGSVNGIYQFSNGPFSGGESLGPIVEWQGITVTGPVPSP